MVADQLGLSVAVPAGDLYGTRTSGRWETQPGRMDVLNIGTIWPRTGKYGIPALEPCDFEPENLAAWHDPKGRQEAANGLGAIHFFLDDYRFERVWTAPDKTLGRIEEVGAALTPDFSLWRDMPVACQIWQTYRSRWCGVYWQHNGFKVIPTVSWAEPETYEWAFEGLPENASVAFSTVGIIKDQLALELFCDGLEALLASKKPRLLLVYGRLPTECEWLNLPRVRTYPTFWDTRKRSKRWADADHQAAAGVLRGVELKSPLTVSAGRIPSLDGQLLLLFDDASAEAPSSNALKPAQTSSDPEKAGGSWLVSNPSITSPKVGGPTGRDYERERRRINAASQ